MSTCMSFSFRWAEGDKIQDLESCFPCMCVRGRTLRHGDAIPSAQRKQNDMHAHIAFAACYLPCLLPGKDRALSLLHTLHRAQIPENT